MFKYILVPSTGEETDASVFATALAAARLSAAHLAFLHVQVDAQRILVAMTNAADTGGGIAYRGVAEALERRCAERHRKALLAFRAFCEREHLTVPGEPSLNRPSAEWKLETGDEALRLAEYGRAADLMVLGRVREGGTARMRALETSLTATGRPVLIAPAEAPARLTGNVAIAWKDRPEAARAVSAARPFIEMADHVTILSVDEGMELGEQSCDKLRSALSWHNPNITLQRLGRDGRPPVEVLLDAAGAAEADLLVMGGYGHRRARELIFGGFTRRVLDGAELPVLMMH